MMARIPPSHLIGTVFESIVPVSDFNSDYLTGAVDYGTRCTQYIEKIHPNAISFGIAVGRVGSIDCPLSLANRMRSSSDDDPQRSAWSVGAD